jgi:hypothetical protein
MTDNKSKNETNPLDKAIANILTAMEAISPTAEVYSKMVDMLEKLYKIKASERPDRVSKDQLVSIGGSVLSSLIGIGMILHHEKLHVVASKALGFVAKARI